MCFLEYGNHISDLSGIKVWQVLVERFGTIEPILKEWYSEWLWLILYIRDIYETHIWRIFVTREVSKFDKGWLNTMADTNCRRSRWKDNENFVRMCGLQGLSSKSLPILTMAFISVTREVSKFDISWLNFLAPLNLRIDSWMAAHWDVRVQYQKI